MSFFNALRTGLISLACVLTGLNAGLSDALAQTTGDHTKPHAVEVWKSPSCGCCGKWIQHLRGAGFKVRVTDTDRMSVVKSQHGVPDGLRACHTAKVGGYVVEGHVPASDILKLLASKPSVSGIAVPGMPLGSPGMEMPGGDTEPYETVTFDQAGKTKVFTKH